MGSSELAEYPWPSTLNVANFVSVRPSLNGKDLKRSINDYKVWKVQMQCLLESQHLLGFVDGQIPQPSTSPEQKLWRRTDQMIKGWIFGSIAGTDLLDAVLGLNTSMEVWSTLEKILEPGSSVHANLNLEYDFTGTNLSKPSTLFYRAALTGDCVLGGMILGGFGDLLKATINSDSETALHVAVGARSDISFVRMLLLGESMSNETLLLKNGSGNNALHVAAIVGNTDAAELLVSKYPGLLYTLGLNNNLPVHLAALYARKDTLEYLIAVSEESVENTPFEGMLGASLLKNTIASGFIDVALKLVMTYPYITRSRDREGDHALNVIAGMKHVFPSGESFSWWQNWIYLRLPLKKFDWRYYTIGMESHSSGSQLKQKFNWFQKISFVVTEGSKEMIWLRSFLEELGQKLEGTHYTMTVRVLFT